MGPSHEQAANAIDGSCPSLLYYAAEYRDTRLCGLFQVTSDVDLSGKRTTCLSKLVMATPLGGSPAQRMSSPKASDKRRCSRRALWRARLSSAPTSQASTRTRRASSRSSTSAVRTTLIRGCSLRSKKSLRSARRSSRSFAIKLRTYSGPETALPVKIVYNKYQL